MSTTTIYSDASDGYFLTGLGSWSSRRSLTSSTVTSDSVASNFRPVGVTKGGGVRRRIQRSFFEFDTSSITTPVSSASFSFLCTALMSGSDMIVVRSEQSNPLVADDFDSLYNSSTELGNSDGSGSGTLASVSGLTYSSSFTPTIISGETQQQQAITLNSTCLNDIQSLDTLRICAMNYSFDYLDINPSSNRRIGLAFEEKTGTRNDPQLIITLAPSTNNAVLFGTNF